MFVSELHVAKINKKHMKVLNSLKCFIGLFLLTNIPQLVSAKDTKPVFHFSTCSFVSQRTQSDTTLLPNGKNIENSDGKPTSEIIKTVPKARKQVVPILVPVQVKPPLIIKPKIIKILH